MALVGYARSRNCAEKMELQVSALYGAGVEVVYQDDASAAAVRPGLSQCLAALKKGDALLVGWADRLERDIGKFIKLRQKLAQQGVVLRVLDAPELVPINQAVLMALFKKLKREERRSRRERRCDMA